jgi:hypothetical protein
MSISNQTFIWPAQFSCSLIRDDFIYPNQYNISVSMHPENTADLTKIGFKKLKHFVYSYIDNSILIRNNHPLLKNFNAIKTNTIHLPDDTHDYMLVTILFHKFSAILQNQITITEISIDSSIGDRVKYTVNTGNKELNGNDWWNLDNVNTNNQDAFPNWNDINLQNNRFEPKVVLGGKNENRFIR